jgi:hypothetical protein
MSEALAPSHAPKSSDVGVSRDRFLLWPLLFAFGIPIAAGLLSAADPTGAPFIVLFWILIWGIAGLAAAVCVVLFARRKAWRRAASAALLPVMIVATWLNFHAVFGPFLALGDQVHFWVKRGRYDAEVAKLPRDQGPRFAAFTLGGFMLNPSYVVFDESDEIALPPGRQSPGWEERAGHAAEIGSCPYDAHHLGAHFYVVRFSC